MALMVLANVYVGAPIYYRVAVLCFSIRFMHEFVRPMCHKTY